MKRAVSRILVALLFSSAITYADFLKETESGRHLTGSSAPPVPPPSGDASATGLGLGLGGLGGIGLGLG
jgi:hypothetical protein